MMAASSGSAAPPSGGNGGGGKRQQTSNVVRSFEDTESTLEDLFSVVQNPNKVANPFRQKNLPPSFFKPPEVRNSRENLLLSGGEGANSTFAGQPTHPGIVTQHIRSRSSPAQLPNSLSMQQQPPPSHRPQHSMDLDYTPTSMDLGQGWNERNRYMLSPGSQQGQQQQQTSPHNATNSGSNQWNQKSMSSGNLVENNNTLSPASSHGPSPATSLQNLSLSQNSNNIHILPAGWDISLTADNEIYFINHLDKSTSWYHPLSQRTQQQGGPMKLSQLPHAQQQIILQQQQQQQAKQAAAAAQQLQQQQQQQPNNQQQQQQQPRAPAPPVQSPPAPAAPNGNGTGTEQQIYMELRRLQQERERLKREQEDITRKERLLQTNIGRPGQSPPSTTSSSSSTSGNNNAPLGIIGEEPSTNFNGRQFQELMLKKDLLLSPAPTNNNDSSTTSLALQQQHAAAAAAAAATMAVGIDPFLSQAPSGPTAATLESHARQNSADSGLGGMGTNYSLPRTDDILSNVEEMDSCSDGGPKMMKSGVGCGGLGTTTTTGPVSVGGLGGGDFSMGVDLGGTGPTSMDIGALDVADPSTMGDDLMSSLQDDLMGADLLNDVDIQKLNPTWL